MNHYMVCPHDVAHAFERFSGLLYLCSFSVYLFIDYQENIFLGIIVSIVLVVTAIC